MNWATLTPASPPHAPGNPMSASALPARAVNLLELTYQPLP